MQSLNYGYMASVDEMVNMTYSKYNIRPYQYFLLRSSNVCMSTEVPLLSRPEGVAAAGASRCSLNNGVTDLYPVLLMWVQT